ncbi:MAG: hypothetical protein Q4P34_01280 [Tissierellia bacterium]|nr:hypothetical protein [Tissierellia bacterium]
MAYVNSDLVLVEDVFKRDDEIDNYFDGVKIDILMIEKYLEGISDHAENIVNWVNYLIRGEHLNKKLGCE